MTNRIILVVDDDRDCRKSLAELLEIKGLKAVTASTGEEALKILKGNNICLMLVDLMMPGMGGEEFIKTAFKSGYKYPCLVVTALAPWQTAGLTSLGVGYIRKPYNSETLIGAIKTLLRKEDLWD